MKAIKRGSKGDKVKQIQQSLGIKADGDFGPATELAVMKFQGQNGLTSDGIVGPNTWPKLIDPKPKYSKIQIKSAVLSKGYDWFEDGDYNLNIVGVRNSATAGRVTNHYDDNMTLSYNVNGTEKFHCWPNTTDPGEYWIDHPMNKDGCAILVPGQYKGVYKIDGHGKSRYTALCQRHGKVRVYRDGNKDDVYDTDEESITEGRYGINIHRSSAYKTGTYINKYSAGCQVFADPDDFDDFMDICQKSKDIWGNAFTYTLIESKDIV